MSVGGFIVIRRRKFHNNSSYGKMDSGNQFYEVDLFMRPLAAFAFPVLAAFSLQYGKNSRFSGVSYKL
jgi:hypothetical protein